MPETRKRKPRAFRADDPAVASAAEDWTASDGADDFAAGDEADPSDGDSAETGYRLPTRDELAGGIRWGSLFITAAVSLALLALGVWFARFISSALEADGFLGWLANSLLIVLVIAGAVLAVREVIGLIRLRRLEDLRADAERIAADPDAKSEADLVSRVLKLYRGRADLRWRIAEFREHGRDMREAGDLIAFLDRDVIGHLDREARGVILSSAKRVSIVTAISPLIFIDVLFVFFENVRMLRRLAALYGGRPGFLGGVRLIRMVIVNLVAAGGVALTDDLFGQFLGQDLLRRVSRRLGEGAFNGALTVRMGVAAVGLIRPMPSVATDPVRVRDVLAELFKWQRAAATGRADGDTVADDEDPDVGAAKRHRADRARTG
ncbi:MAG: TIGR01620 family protein [Pseudomonadota bacterium]